jgi:hypothetical protein
VKANVPSKYWIWLTVIQLFLVAVIFGVTLSPATISFPLFIFGSFAPIFASSPHSTNI